MDKRLKLFAISLTSIISVTTLGAVAFNFSDNIAFNARATENIEITLDSSEKPEIDNDGNGTLTYSKNNYATFSYTGASDYETGHVSLNDGGTIYKNQASNNLKTFTANFTGGSLKLQTGYLGIGVDDVCYEYSLTSGTTFDVGGNYFKLISTGTTNISEIEIVFGCETGVEEPTHTYKSEWTTNETYHWHESEDPNCVRKGNYGEHNIADIDIVAPTKETTGSYNGKKCSVCNRVLVEPTVLPILSATDYDISYRTAMIEGQVRDSEKYTLKTDTSIYFDIGYGETVYTEYIHAGSSYYSLNRWNELFPAAQATAVDGVLTINLTGDTTVTSEAGGALDGQLDLMLYDSVVIDGSGSLTVEYGEAIDGIEAWNLEIKEGATVNLIGYDKTSKTGFKVYGILQIDGTANVKKYGNAVGFNNDKTGSSSKAFKLNIGSTGTLIIDQAGNGINVWNNGSEATSINVDGTLTMTDISGEGIRLAQIVPINFNDGSNTSISAQKSGIDYTIENSSNAIRLFGNAKVTMNITTGSGILFYKQGGLFLNDNSKLEITAGSSGLYGFTRLCVCDGNEGSHTKNSASLLIHAAGNKGSSTSAVDSSGRTPDGNPIQARAGASHFTFDTTGEVLIEKTGTRGRTGIHFGGSKNSNATLNVYASNMTIKNCDNAMGCWTNRNWTVNYDYTSSGCGKVNIINCTNIYSGNTSTISTKFTSTTCNVS